MEKKELPVLSFVTDYVPIGYLYLILLGIASDTGINFSSPKRETYRINFEISLK